MVVGIDFSLGSPGICINTGKEIIFYGGIREGVKFRKIETKCHDTISSIKGCNIFKIQPKIKSEDYSTQEFLNMRDGAMLIDLIIGILKKEVSDPKDCMIAVEGFSYASKGAFVSSMYGCGFMLRYRLWEEGYAFKIVSPKTVKMKAGKGNFNKNQMGDAFLDNVLKDEMLNLNFLRMAVINNKEAFRDTKNYLKPFEDMVDSYFLMKCI